jgi:hypothetical protein
LFHKPIVHVIGDSHVSPFLGEKLFLVHHVGPATAFGLIKTNSATKSNKKLFKVINNMEKNRDVALLVFGEIDCRLHIFNQYRKSVEIFTLEEIMRKTIYNYSLIMEQINALGISFYVYGVPPASTQRNIYNYEYYADQKTRIEINKKYNNMLKKFCIENGYRYIDVYEISADDNGLIKTIYAKDEVHLNNNIVPYVKSILKNDHIGPY